MVAAGFNPRLTIAPAIWRRVATHEELEKTLAFNRRSATTGAASAANRGLKPTATFISSLRDEVSALTWHTPINPGNSGYGRHR
jgi:hypothetical protein